MRVFCSALILCALSAAAFAGEGTVTIKVENQQAEVAIGGEHFTTYQFSKDLPKPFFFPVKVAGVTASRPLLQPGDDHPHHKGIWLAVDEVNDVKFWAEKGKIENVSVKPVVPQGNPAVLHVVNHWLGEDGKPVVTESSTIRIFNNRLMAYEIVFTAGDKPVKFGDTKEGLFGFRMVNSMRENEGGQVVNAEGKEGTKACWGLPSAWIDYYGPVEGKTVGVTIFDHPGNFRPSRFHVRNYGLFSINPFGEKAYTGGKNEANEATLDAGKSLTLRYGIYFHEGDTAAGNVSDAYQQYLAAFGQKLSK